MKRLILIDLSNFIYWSYYATVKWSKYKGSEYIITYDVLEDQTKKRIQKIIKLAKTDNILLVMDKGQPWRNLIYPKYKKDRILKNCNRSNRDKDMLHFLKKNLLDTYYSIQNENCEADDIIGVISRISKDITLFVVSSDSDMIQFADKNVIIYSPTLKKIYDTKDLTCMENKILRGEPGDGIDKPTNEKEIFINRLIIDMRNIPQIFNHEITSKFSKIRNLFNDL